MIKEEICDIKGFSHGEYAEIVIIVSLLCSRNLVTSFALCDVQLSQNTARAFCYFSSPLPIESKRERKNVLEYFSIDCSFYDYCVVIPTLRQRNNSTNLLWVRKLLDKSLWIYGLQMYHLLDFGLNTNSSTKMSSIGLHWVSLVSTLILSSSLYSQLLSLLPVFCLASCNSSSGLVSVPLQSKEVKRHECLWTVSWSCLSASLVSVVDQLHHLYNWSQHDALLVFDFCSRIAGCILLFVSIIS